MTDEELLIIEQLTCELIKQVFEKAKELDYEYSKTVMKRSDAVKELTDIFFTDFGID